MHSEHNKLMRHSLKALAASLSVMLGVSLSNCSAGDVDIVKVVSDRSGHKLTVADTAFFVNGMNWDYYPIGTNYNYKFWHQPDEFIIAVLEEEMTALKAIDINTIRQYVGVPPRWVKYIHETYDIFTILNHPFARYGTEIDGEWVANVDYGNPALREKVLRDVTEMVEQFRYVPGVLMWLLGNENNYGLIWNSAETRDMPKADKNDLQQARELYSLLNEAIRIIHIRDNRRPVAIANGDLQFIDVIAEEIKNLDIFGTNSYRGASFGDLFQVVNDKLGVPLLFTEFGADAFHATEMQEDQESQARFLLENWREIYENSKGRGLVGNAIGGCTFQFSDGWWKSGPDDNLDIHDPSASWSNGGYKDDFVPGQNNMNEEWFGVCAKQPTDRPARYNLLPRKAYYVLQQVHSLSPLSPDISLEDIQSHFTRISYNLIDTNSEQTPKADEMTTP